MLLFVGLMKVGQNPKYSGQKIFYLGKTILNYFIVFLYGQSVSKTYCLTF